MRKKFPWFTSGLSLIVGLTLLPLQANAVPAPTFGQPDIHIDLRQPNSDPISLDDSTFEFLLNDLRQLPPLFQDEIMPVVKSVLLEHEEELIGKYIHYISVQYDMDQMMRIEIITQPRFGFPAQTIEVQQIVSPAIITLRYVQITMAMSVNSTSPVMYESMINRLEEINLSRIQILANHGIDTLTSSRDKLQNFSPTGIPTSPDSDNTEAVIGLIVLKMIDTDLARATIYYPVNESGEQPVAVDEMKAIVVPEFPISMLLLAAAIGSMIALIATKNRGKLAWH